MSKTLVLIFICLNVSKAFSNSIIEVSTNEACEGFAKVKNFKTLDSKKCLGLALSGKDVPWVKPRRIVFKNKNTLVVTDMGGWNNRRSGAVWEVDLRDKSYKKVYEGGDWTHGLAIDSKNRILIGDTDQVIRIEENGKIKVLIKDLPVDGSHPLTHFILLPNQDIILNVGAPSNDCVKTIVRNECKQRDAYGEVRLYKYRKRVDAYDRSSTRLARGLRNSMALLFNEKMDFLYQAENKLDQPGIAEEFNQIPLTNWFASTDFGWPFCHGFGNQYVFPKVEGRVVVKPNTFRTFCGQKAEEPLFLIPPHSSPLDMMYYSGQAHPELEGDILMSWHGHRRDVEFSLVSYDTDLDGHPVYGRKDYGSFKGLIEGASKSLGKNKIRPVGLSVDSRGLIWMVDDVNNSILVYGNSTKVSLDEDEKASDYEKRLDESLNNLSADSKRDFEGIYTVFYETGACVDCHGPKELPREPALALKTLFLRGWLDLDEPPSKMNMMKRMSKDSKAPMPKDKPFEEMEPEIYNELLDWLREEF